MSLKFLMRMMSNGKKGDRIRDLGGKLGDKAAANEDEYFYKKQQEDLNKLRKTVEEKIEKLAKENDEEMERIRKKEKDDERKD